MKHKATDRLCRECGEFKNIGKFKQYMRQGKNITSLICKDCTPGLEILDTDEKISAWLKNHPITKSIRDGLLPGMANERVDFCDREYTNSKRKETTA